MIRRILLPLDSSKYTQTGLHYAIDLAKRYDAEISGMVVLDLPGINDSIGPYVAGGVEYAELFREKELKQAQEHIERLLHQFSETCQANNIKHREFEYQGSPSENIIKESFFFDLLIMGLRNYFHFDPTQVKEESLEKILDYTITPILAVPESNHSLKNVLILCDGTPSSARALQRFSHIAERNTFRITLLATMKDKKEADFFLSRSTAYLEAYSLSSISTKWSPHPSREALEKEFLQDIDLIVFGIHQHKTLKEYILGDLARYFIRENRWALFIVH